jgi:hypothetical protein
VNAVFVPFLLVDAHPGVAALTTGARHPGGVPAVFRGVRFLRGEMIVMTR